MNIGNFTTTELGYNGTIHTLCVTREIRSKPARRQPAARLPSHPRRDRHRRGVEDFAEGQRLPVH
jgi:uncharacterized protein (DUF736 family)